MKKFWIIIVGLVLSLSGVCAPEGKYHVELYMSELDDKSTIGTVSGLGEFYKIGYQYEYSYLGKDLVQFCYSEASDFTGCEARPDFYPEPVFYQEELKDTVYVDVSKEFEFYSEIKVHLEPNDNYSVLPFPTVVKNFSQKFSSTGFYSLNSYVDVSGIYKVNGSPHDYIVKWQPVDSLYIKVWPSELNFYYQKEELKIAKDKYKTIQLSYADTIFVSATSGFPNEVYKWVGIWGNKSLDAGFKGYIQGVGSHATNLTSYRIDGDYSRLAIPVKDIVSSEAEFLSKRETDNYYISMYGWTGYNKPLNMSSHIKIKPVPIGVTLYNDGTESGTYCSDEDVKRLFEGQNTIKTDSLVGENSAIKNLDEQNGFVYNANNKGLRCPEDKVSLLIKIKNEGRTYDCAFSQYDEIRGTERIIPSERVNVYSSQDTTYYVVSGFNQGERGTLLLKPRYIIPYSVKNGVKFYQGMAGFVSQGCLYDSIVCNNHEFPYQTPKVADLKIDNISVPSIKCYGEETSLSCQVAGGLESSVYRTLLVNGVDTLASYSKNPTFEYLKAGDYKLIMTTNDFCAATVVSQKITQPDSLWLNITETKDVLIHGQNTGEMRAEVGRGKQTSELELLELSLNETTYQPTAEDKFKYDVRNLYAGDYKVILRDSNACIVTDSFSISQPDPLEAKVVQTKAIKCYGENTASIKVDSIKGGLGSYSVRWSDESILMERDFLEAGIYTVVVRDSVGAQLVLDYEITQPDSLYLSINKIDVKCVGDTDGEIEIVPNGGTAPYQYLLKVNDIFYIENKYKNLTEGTYYAQLIDDNGCRTEFESVEIKTLSHIGVSHKLTNPLCIGDTTGVVEIQISQGVSPYSVEWEDGQIFQSSDSIMTRSDLKAGTYNVIVKDSVECGQVETFTLTEPKNLDIDLDEDELLHICSGQEQTGRLIHINDESVTSVKWYKEGELESTERTYGAKTVGAYELVVRYNDDQCEKHYPFGTHKSNLIIESNFIVAETVPTGDDVRLVNISSPEHFSTASWLYDENEIWKYDEGKNYVDLVFLREGKHEITLITTRDTPIGECVSETTRTITAQAGLKPASNNEKILKANLKVIPYRETGNFEAQIEIEADYTLLSNGVKAKFYLFNVGAGKSLMPVKEEIMTTPKRTISFNQNLSTGQYLLMMIIEDYGVSEKSVFTMD